MDQTPPVVLQTLNGHLDPFIPVTNNSYKQHFPTCSNPMSVNTSLLLDSATFSGVSKLNTITFLPIEQNGYVQSQLATAPLAAATPAMYCLLTASHKEKNVVARIL